MNCFKTVSLYLVFAITLIAPRASLFAAPAPEKPQENRLLFLIETTPKTDNERAAIRKSLRSIIESGLDGHMHYGDTIGLWAYNDKVNTDFPMVIWTHEHQQDVENAIDFWMTKQKFKGRADFSKVLPPLQNVIKASQKLTIIWYSAGDSQITGTPYDKEIAELQKEFRDDFRKQHIPFATLLAVRKGAVVDFTVNPGDGKIRLPEIYDKEAAATATAATNPPAEATAPVAKKPPLIIRIGPSPEVLAQKKANAPAPAATNSAVTNVTTEKLTNAIAVPSATVQSNAPAALSTNAPAPIAIAPVLVKTNAPAVTTTNAPVAALAKTNAPSVAAAVPTNNNTNQTTHAPVVEKPKPVEAAPKPSVTPQPSSAVVSAQPNYALIAIGGTILAAIAGVIVFFVKKSSVPKGPSFISQSMTRERLNSDESKRSSDNPAAPE